MGRKLPQVYHNNNRNNPAHHPLLSSVFLLCSIATTVTIVTVLCGFLSRKKEKRRRQCNATTIEVETENNEDGEPSLNSPQASDEAVLASSKAPKEDRLPMPPAAKRAASYHFRSSSHASMTHKKATLASSMSMRVGGDTGKEKKREKKLKHEDSIWKKTIILGEKCKIPDEEEDDDIVYDEKGNKVTPYHPKTSIALQPLSRQSSQIHQGDDEDHVNLSCKIDQMIVIDNNQ